MFSITFAVSTLVYIPGGYLADHYERRTVFVIVSLLATPAFLIYAWARTWTDLIPGVVLFSMTIISMPAFAAYISSSVSKSDAMSSFGVVYAGASAGFILSPILGGWLLTVADFSLLFYAALVLWLVSTLILIPLTPQRPSPHEKGRHQNDWLGLRPVLREPGIFRWVVLITLALAAVQIAIPFIPTFLADARNFSIVAVQYAGSARFLGATVLGVGLGRLGDRRRRSIAVALGLSLFAGGALLLILGEALLSIGMSMFLLGVFVALRSLGDSVIGQLSPRNSAGQVYSIYYTVTGLGQLVTPYIGGLLYTISTTIPFITAATACLFLSLLAYLVPSRETHVSK